MEVVAKTRYLRISPKKMRLVIDVIRGMSVIKAEDQLHFIPRKASGIILKTLKSAIANAENNFNLKADNLYIKKIVVDGGPSLERWMPKAFGRATPIKKRSSHLSIVLSEYKPTTKIEKRKIAEIKSTAETVQTDVTETKETKDQVKKHRERSIDDKKNKLSRSGTKLKIFSRKTM